MSWRYALNRCAVLSILLGVSATAFAEVSRQPVYRDIRWLGRANTGVALISDGTAAFYNPAGLGKENVFNIALLNPSIGGNQNIYSSAQAFLGSSPTSINDYFTPLMGKPLAGQVSTFPYVRVPHFMMGYFISNSEVFDFHNPVSPELGVDYRYDRGIVLGGAFDIQQKLFLGASIRYQKRSMIQETFGGAVILNATLATLLQDITVGEGWGLNMGAQYRYDLGSDQALHLGVAFEDLGRTTFRSRTLGTGAPLTQATYTSAGLAFTGQIPAMSYALLIDLKNLGEYSQSYSKKLQLGAEVSIPAFTFRGGMYQGYWSAGLSMAILPFMSLDLTSYAEELGVAGGQQSNRYYMLGLQVGMDLNKKKQRKQKYTLDHL